MPAPGGRGAGPVWRAVACSASASSSGAWRRSPQPSHPIWRVFLARGFCWASARRRLSRQMRRLSDVVPATRAQLCDLADRCGGKARFGHRCAAARHAADTRRVALELRRDGCISLLYLLLFRRVYREPEEDPGADGSGAPLIAGRRENEPPAATGPELSLGALLRQRKVIGLSLGFGAYNYVFYLLLTWLPSYLSMALHIDLLHSFLYTGVPWLIATATDLFVGGMLVDALVSRGWNAELVRKSCLWWGLHAGWAFWARPMRIVRCGPWPGSACRSADSLRQPRSAGRFQR